MAKKSKYTTGNFKLRVKRSYAGNGLFAMEDIPKGACIIEYVGKPVSAEDKNDNAKRYLFWTGRNKMIDGNVPENTARYINHSCKPNCEADGPSGKVFIMALRRIKAGEELTYDYGDEYFDMYFSDGRCRCAGCA